MNEITYTVEIADMKAFQRHYRRVSPTMRRLRLFMLLLFSGLSLDAAIRKDSGSMGLRITYFFVMLALFLIVFRVLISLLTWFTQWRAHRDGDRHGVLGPHIITLTPEALHERTAVNDSNAVWRSIFRVDGTPKHIFIFTQPNAAHVIPRRAFATPADADVFLTTAKSYYDAAQRGA